MEEKKNQVAPDDDMPSAAAITKSIVSICVCGVLGWIASFMFDWAAWWSIGIGIVIGWALPGFIEGAKEEIKDSLRENEQ